MRAAGLPLADAVALRPRARRTRLARLTVAAALATVAVVAVLLARGGPGSAGAFVPSGSNTIIVLDVSESVELDKLRLAYSTLSFLGQSHSQVGLIVVSSYAYEALPPGTPSAALLPIAKLFRPIHVAPRPFGARRFVLPPNPWRAAFSAGTEIASGLQLARSIITTAHLRRPTVVLISDLLDDGNDLERVNAEGQAYQRLGIPLRIVGLAPAPGDLQFFLHAAGHQGSLLRPKVPRQAALQLRNPFPTALVVAAGGMAVLLAVDEALFAPLRWRRRRLAGDAA